MAMDKFTCGIESKLACHEASLIYLSEDARDTPCICKAANVGVRPDQYASHGAMMARAPTSATGGKRTFSLFVSPTR